MCAQFFDNSIYLSFRLFFVFFVLFSKCEVFFSPIRWREHINIFVRGQTTNINPRVLYSGHLMFFGRNIDTYFNDFVEHFLISLFFFSLVHQKLSCVICWCCFEFHFYYCHEKHVNYTVEFICLRSELPNGIKHSFILYHPIGISWSYF